MKDGFLKAAALSPALRVADCAYNVRQITEALRKAAARGVKLAVFPLTKKDGMPEKAQEIVDNLKFHFTTHIEAKDSIGKRYRRQDAIGTPFCVTVDGQTLEDNTVTLRFRDSMDQERVSVDKLREIIEDRVSITSVLKKLNQVIKQA